MEKIGIVLPTYNRPEKLKRALESIVRNGSADFFVCVVDDGSARAEEVRNVVDEYRGILPMHYRYQKNSGVNVARNRAMDFLIDEERCDYLIFLDDDDTLMENAGEKIITAIRKTGGSWVVGLCMDDDGNAITKTQRFGEMDYLEYRYLNKMSGDAAHIVHKDLIGKTRFAEEVRNGHEWTFFVQLSQKATMSVVDEFLIVKEYCDDGLTKTFRKNYGRLRKEEARLEEIYLKPLGLSRRSLLRRYLAEKRDVQLREGAFVEAAITTMRMMIGK